MSSLNSRIDLPLEGRTNKSCRKRWIHSLDPELRRGRWTSMEDFLLRNAIDEHGQLWWKVAKHVPGRTDDQCAKRWREKLDPSISRAPWSLDEDKVLLAACGLHGTHWNAIAAQLPGRPPVHCRNRFQSLRRSMVSLGQESLSAASPTSSSSSAVCQTFFSGNICPTDSMSPYLEVRAKVWPLSVI